MLKTSYLSILKVAVPLMAGTFIQSLVMITDAAILSRHSTLSFDASGNAGLIYLTLFMGLTGLGDAAQIIIARRVGAKEPHLVNGLVQSSFLLNVLLGSLFFLLVVLVVPTMLHSYSNNIALADEQIQFLNIRSIGFVAAAFMLTLNAFFMAIGKTWVIFLSTSVFAVSNILLDYYLVFGFGSVPPMGIEGAAWASVISEWLTVAILLLFLLISKEKKKFNLFSKLAIPFHLIKRIAVVGSPLVFQGFVALATWAVFFTWLEQLGTYELTVSQNIRAVYFLAFVPIFGFGSTTRTYIAQYISWNNPKIINRIIKRIQLLILIFLIVFFHGAILYPTELIRMINPEELYIEESARILRLVFGSVLVFGLATPLFQTINGSGNTKISLLVEVAAILTYLSFAYFFIKVWDFNIYQIWTVEYIYFGSMLLFSFIYLRFFNWRNKKF